MKILTVIGARPQFVKAAVVSRAIFVQQAAGQKIEEIIVHTGQHFDRNMSQDFFEQLSIPTPKYNLNIHSSDHGEMTGQMLIKLEPILLTEKPDLVLVYGDTNSTLAGALCAVKQHIPVAHVEAGLRSFNRSMPEEINRVMTDHVSSLLFCPTNTACYNLTNEGLSSNIYHTGDVMYDAFLAQTLRLAPKGQEHKTKDKKSILFTCHRAENTDCREKLQLILQSAEQLAEQFEVIFPIHPRTKSQINAFSLNTLLNKITVIDPLSYPKLIEVLLNCDLVMTDSGGLQKEAYFAQKPCVILRSETEWLELLDIPGYSLGLGNNQELVDNCLQSISITIVSNELYGDGNAGHKIVSEVLKKFGSTTL